MATTVVYEGYEQDEFNREVEISRAPHPNGPRQSARLAPIHVPESVDFELSSNGDATIRFHYSNQENEERRPRQLVRNTRIAVLLGKHTGKILRMSVREAQQQFRNGSVTFDPKEAGSWVNSFPPPRRWVVMRNAEVAAAILSSMPENVRVELLGAFAKIQQSSAPDAPSDSLFREE